ncbi:AbiH family protein [Flavobacterium sp. ZT3R25]|uniref:AbiH family protein n=1 Tax=Flavobacterium galactosi TaxID=3398735 RepID=UPI003A8AEAB1
MNRLVILGNGFDLAHGLPTSYRDFIDDYWRGIKDSNHNDEFVSFDCNSKVEFENVKNIDCISKQFIALNQEVKFSEAEIYTEYGNNILTGKYPRAHILNYKNIFFRLINQKSIQNWVDIENEYYTQLKGIVNLKPENRLVDKDEFEISRKDKIIKLNTEFDQVKKSLEKYLNDKIIIDEERVTTISDLLRINLGEDKYFLEFPSQDYNELKDFYKEYSPDKRKEIITYCLNFNYTKTIDKYISFTKEYGEDRNFGEVKNLQIHGRLNDNGNRINFGFGDEMDDNYKLIENIDDNEYLKYFKSFQYLQNSNYKTLLDFIEGNNFQVQIMGHSCGLSDRALLNTVFEHVNCRSIKVFYHNIKDENGKVIKDNYTEIIQNISRHFNKKSLMRSKIVNKNLCQPLPQI